MRGQVRAPPSPSLRRRTRSAHRLTLHPLCTTPRPHRRHCSPWLEDASAAKPGRVLTVCACVLGAADADMGVDGVRVRACVSGDADAAAVLHDRRRDRPRARGARCDRDCYFADIPSPSILIPLPKAEGGAAAQQPRQRCQVLAAEDPSDHKPVVIADVWDNPGGGVAGDSTWIIHRLQARGVRRGTCSPWHTHTHACTCTHTTHTHTTHTYTAT